MSAIAELSKPEVVKPPTFELIDPEKQLEWVNGHAEVKELAGARNGRIETRRKSSPILLRAYNKSGKFHRNSKR